MEDITLILNCQGFDLPDKRIVREISWIHVNQPIGETIQVFESNYRLNAQEKGIVNKVSRNITGLRFKRFPNNKSLWMSNDEVKYYITNLHNKFGGKFAHKDLITKDILKELNIESIELSNFPRCPRIMGEGCSMFRCIHYKNHLTLENYEVV